jgi:glycosyltransferase involved in cell wall biosynthesis
MNKIDKKIKVMFVATSISGGGAEQVFFNILNSLSLEKYDIFLAITSIADKTTLEIDSAVKVSIYNKENARNSIFKIYKEIQKFQPDYIFTSDLVIAYIFPLLRLFSAIRFKIIIRIAVPPSEYPLNDVKTKIVQLLSKFTYRNADLIIAQTQFMKKDVQSYYLIPENKIVVIRNLLNESLLIKKGNESPDIQFNPEYFNLVASGALYSVKGFDLLIDAIKSIRNNIPNIRLYILGDERYETGYKTSLQKLIQKYELEHTVFLLGHKINPFPYYKAADLFVLSSKKEGFPNVVLEALFLGTPVVATDCVDFSDLIVNGENGFIVKKDSSESLVEGILNAYRFLRKRINVRLPKFNYEEIFQEHY